MSLRSRIALTHRQELVCRVLGLCVFIAAFLMPACRDKAPFLGSLDIYPGWQCAQVTFVGAFSKNSYQSWDVLAVMSGWINPLILVYFVLSFTARFALLRRVLAVATLVCMVATWVFFFIASLVPMIGHVLWIVGALIILSSEVTGRRPAQSEDGDQIQAKS